MNGFHFSRAEILEHTQDRAAWFNFVRRREAEAAFQPFSLGQFGCALEIGAGNGCQSEVIAKHCRHLICTDVVADSHAAVGIQLFERRLPNVDYQICDAQDLSQFGDASMDLIYSSNVLEHIPDISAALREFKRVLKPNGRMLHAMPNRVWKFANYAYGVIRRRPTGIHGISQTHWEEFRRFGRSSWRLVFAQHGFAVRSTMGMPFYMGHGPRWKGVLIAGNWARLPASFLYDVVHA